jgi:hypothetical protein
MPYQLFLSIEVFGLNFECRIANFELFRSA